MPRTLTVLFRRDRSRDRFAGAISFEGYQLLWPDGRPVVCGLEAFCRYGQRLLGLGRFLGGRSERLIQITCFPLANRDDALNRLPGQRVRRMCLQRDGQVGRIHLLDGTPTAAVFEMGRDEPPVLHWIGLTGVGDGEWQWLDLAASPVPTSGCPAAGSGGEKGKPPAAQQGAWVVADGAGAEFGCNAPPLIVDVKQTRGCRR